MRKISAARPPHQPGGAICAAMHFKIYMSPKAIQQCKCIARPPTYIISPDRCDTQPYCCFIHNGTRDAEPSRTKATNGAMHLQAKLDVVPYKVAHVKLTKKFLSQRLCKGWPCAAIYSGCVAAGHAKGKHGTVSMICSPVKLIGDGGCLLAKPNVVRTDVVRNAMGNFHAYSLTYFLLSYVISLFCARHFYVPTMLQDGVLQSMQDEFASFKDSVDHIRHVCFTPP